LRLSFLLVLAACTSETDTGAELAHEVPLAETFEISGDCPDFSQSNIGTMTSDGLERKVGIVLPDPMPENPAVLFAWHGLVGEVNRPVESFFQGASMFADLADTVVIIPEAQPLNLLGQEVLLWGFIEQEGAESDLVLYDDLRACAAKELGADMARVASWGHSGGGLWTSHLVMHRGDTLAAAVSSSGGTDLEIPLLGDRHPYVTPESPVPTLIISGGPTDVWPDASLPVIEFDVSSQNFVDGLTADGHVVMHCLHDEGHFSWPNWAWTVSIKWLGDHVYGQGSPWITGERSVRPECTLYQP